MAFAVRVLVLSEHGKVTFPGHSNARFGEDRGTEDLRRPVEHSAVERWKIAWVSWVASLLSLGILGARAGRPCPAGLGRQSILEAVGRTDSGGSGYGRNSDEGNGVGPDATNSYLSRPDGCASSVPKHARVRRLIAMERPQLTSLVRPLGGVFSQSTEPTQTAH